MNPEGADSSETGTAEHSSSAVDSLFLELHPKALHANLIAGVIRVLIVLPLVGTVTLTIAQGLNLPALPRGVIVGATILFALWYAVSKLFWPFLSHSRTSYRVDEDGLQIRKGVLWRSHVFIARTRIQHTDVAQGPIQRRFGLGDLWVHTAGAANSRARLSGIALEEASRLRDLLTDRE